MSTIFSLSREQIRAANRGALATFERERGLAFGRLPLETYYQHEHAPVVAMMAERPSGVHLDLVTAAQRLTVRYRSCRDTNLAGGWQAGPSVVSVTSGEWHHSIAHDNGDLRVWNGDRVLGVEPGADSVAGFELPAGAAAGAVAGAVVGSAAVAPTRPVQIWLPHNCPIELLEVSADAPLEPATPRAGDSWLHYGSSISHCEDAASPLAVWPVAASRSLGLDITNLGLGGCANLEQFAARAIRDTPAALISLKLGINVVNGATMTERTFTPAVHGFLDTIREGKPNVPILVISPISCPAHENNPGPSEVGADGMVAGQPPSRFAWVGELTLRSVRSALERVVAQRRDPNLFYLDGLALFDHELARTMPDGIHPDSAGYQQIAANFVRHHHREWVAAR